MTILRHPRDCAEHVPIRCRYTRVKHANENTSCELCGAEFDTIKHFCPALTEIRGNAALKQPYSYDTDILTENLLFKTDSPQEIEERKTTYIN